MYNITYYIIIIQSSAYRVTPIIIIIRSSAMMIIIMITRGLLLFRISCIISGYISDTTYTRTTHGDDELLNFRFHEREFIMTINFNGVSLKLFYDFYLLFDQHYGRCTSYRAGCWVFKMFQEGIIITDDLFGRKMSRSTANTRWRIPIEIDLFLNRKSNIMTLWSNREK